MIDVATTWQQACTALAGDDYDTAFSVLEGALHEADRPQKARLSLYLASVQALYGDPATTEVGLALRDARTADPAIRSDPLYVALSAELDARLRGPDAAPPPPEVREAAEPLARYHALAALSLAGHPAEALEIHLPLTELPPHLRWRLRSWQADAEESLGHPAEARHLYAEAAHHASGLNRAVMLQEGAALELQLGDTEAALSLLEQARPLYGRLGAEEEGLNLATWHYLRAQALLQAGKPDDALTSIREADRLERQHGDPSYGVALVWGQVLTHLGRHDEALAQFTRALDLAGDGDRPFAQHELGVALLDLDRPLEAREHLEAALADPDYPYRPEVLADLAECDYRLGRLQEAQLAAEQALAQGAVIPASMVLGNVALEYYHLDEALDHFERVVREAAQGSRDWVMGHQMAADVMAQQGFRDPAAAYAHAQQALEFTPESDDWRGTLEDHLRKAGALLGQGGGRTLN